VADDQTAQQTATGQNGQSSSSQSSQQTSQGGSQQGNTSQGTTQNSGQQNQSQAATKPSRPDWLPESHWDAEKGIKPEFGQHFRDLTAFKAAEDSRKLTLPQKPEDYKPTNTKDFKAPQGVEFVPNENDPLLPQARAFAAKHGLSQDAFSELMDLHAAGQISNKQMIENAKAAEVQKLGVNGVARKTAVDTWLIANLGEDLGKEMSRFTFTAKQIEAFETLMARARTQGAHNFTHEHREPPPDQGKVTDDQWKTMSPAQRLDYSRRFDQSQFQKNGAAA
jgi:hypothetical protein